MYKEFLINHFHFICVGMKKWAASTLSLLKNNWIYLAWFLFYFSFFALITNGWAILFYLVTVPIALSPLAEWLWRSILGIREIKLQSEADRLLPLFKAVYDGAIIANPNLSKKIRLYIKDDMDINAFAFGKTTLVLTRGSIELLSDSHLQGLLAHELGHFSYRHTEASLISTVGNLPMMFLIRKLLDLKNYFDVADSERSVVTEGIKFMIAVIYYFFKALDFIGDLILMYSSRQQEYNADEFAFRSGFGQELTSVLIAIHNVSIGGSQGLLAGLRSTHPNIAFRIQRLERTF